jgi:hypothetical protein
MMYEEVLPDGTVRVQGLLIDFDYAIKVDGSSHTAGPGDRTVSEVGEKKLWDIKPNVFNKGTLPFMAVELLCGVDDKPVQHTAAHDLKSFVYLLCWIVTFYAGSKSQLHKDSAKLTLEGWYYGSNLGTFANNKEGCMASTSHLNDITKYYSCLCTCIATTFQPHS